MGVAVVATDTGLDDGASVGIVGLAEGYGVNEPFPDRMRIFRNVPLPRL